MAGVARGIKGVGEDSLPHVRQALAQSAYHVRDFTYRGCPLVKHGVQ